MTNKVLYGKLPKLSSLAQKKRLRGNESATKLFPWRDPVHLTSKRSRVQKKLTKDEIIRLANNRKNRRCYDHVVITAKVFNVIHTISSFSRNTRKSSRRYKIFLNFEKSTQCVGLEQATISLLLKGKKVRYFY